MPAVCLLWRNACIYYENEIKTKEDHILTGPILTFHGLRKKWHDSLQGSAGCFLQGQFLIQRLHEEELESICCMGRMHLLMRQFHKTSRPQIGPQSQKLNLPESLCYRTASKQSDRIIGEESSLRVLTGALAHPKLLSLIGCVNLVRFFLSLVKKKIN